MIANLVHDVFEPASSYIIAGSVLGLAGFGGRWMNKNVAKPLQSIPSIVERQVRTENSVKNIVSSLSELLPNGGSSLRDSIDRNERMTQKILTKVDSPSTGLVATNDDVAGVEEHLKQQDAPKKVTSRKRVVKKVT